MALAKKRGKKPKKKKPKLVIPNLGKGGHRKDTHLSLKVRKHLKLLKELGLSLIMMVMGQTLYSMNDYSKNLDLMNLQNYLINKHLLNLMFMLKEKL